jgi:chemotaxis protein methyltransferase CheR
VNGYSEIPDLTEGQFSRFKELIHKEAQITLKPAKITLLSNRLRRRMKLLSIHDFDEYFNFVMKDNIEMVNFLDVVTTNESYFWRTTSNFDLLKEVLLKDILQTFKGQTLKFWSAGSSTGEEPYNLAIELTESMKQYGVFSFKIYGSDLSSRVVDFAKAGRYSGRKIDKIPPMILSRYFVPVPESPGTYEVRPDIKQKIEFRNENLFKSDLHGLHFIFCRNVMIYFSRDDQEKLVNEFYKKLLPGGYLIVGHSESLHMMKTEYKTVHFPNGVAYQRPMNS